MSSIENRLTAIADALERRAMVQEMPVDGLSKSLFDLQAELATLDEQGKTALLEAMNNPTDGESGSLNLSRENFEKFIESVTKG